MPTEQLCDHGTDQARHTLTGEPACPLCRLTHRRITTVLSTLTTPRTDYAALAAHDLQESDP